MEISRFTARDPAADILAAVARDGAAIVERLIDERHCATIVRDIQPILDALPFGWESFSGFKTKRFGAVAARLPSCRPLITHPLVLSLVNGFLAPFTDKICLNSSQFIVPFHGQKDQILHRDGESWLFLPKEVEPELNVIWAISPFTEESGATRLAPGSQRWPAGREPTDLEMVRATMPAGSALVFSGGLIHGGCANRGTDPRIALGLSYCVAWLRAEENHFLSCPPDIARHLDRELQDLLGYTLMSGTLGYYSDPHAPLAKAGLQPPEHALGRFLDALPNPDVTRPLRLVDEDDALPTH